MTQLVNHHMFHTPIRQQQQVSGKANAVILHIAHPPSRLHRFEADGRRSDTHHRCISFHQWLNQRSDLFRRLCLLRLCSQRQLIIERRLQFLSFSHLLSRLHDPFLMLDNKSLHLFFRHTERSRHMNIAILHDAHRQSACPSVCQFYSHRLFFCLNH